MSCYPEKMPFHINSPPSHGVSGSSRHKQSVCSLAGTDGSVIVQSAGLKMQVLLHRSAVLSSYIGAQL